MSRIGTVHQPPNPVTSAFTPPVKHEMPYPYKPMRMYVHEKLGSLLTDSASALLGGGVEGGKTKTGKKLATVYTGEKRRAMGDGTAMTRASARKVIRCRKREREKTQPFPARARRKFVPEGESQSPVGEIGPTAASENREKKGRANNET